MKPIRQTPLGRIACALGFHALAVTGGNSWSVWGGCLRCNRTFQWDNAQESQR